MQSITCRMLPFLAVAALLAPLALCLAAPVQAVELKKVETPYPGGKWVPPPARHGVSVAHYEVAMSDGATLPVDVYFPKNIVSGKPEAGRFPVLLTRTWYTKLQLDGRNPPAVEDVTYFVERGYIYVSADVRGTGRSQDPGSYLGERDALDGVDLINWTRTMPGSNGTVGLIGCSAMGQTQLSTAAMLKPGSPVKAMIPACVPGDQYRDTYSENGVWRSNWAGLLMAAPTVFGTGMVTDFAHVYAGSLQGGKAAFDDAWWMQRNFVAQAPQIVGSGAAVLIWNGWQDVGYGGLELFAALQNAATGRPTQSPLTPGMRVSGKYQLILGDWRHAEGLDKGIQLQWFETWLKGVDTGLPTTTTTPIHVQDRITKDWVNSASYPMVKRYTPFYLGVGSLATTIPPAGKDMLRRDRAPDARLIYETEPFPVSTRLAGPVGVRLNASSSNTDAQFRFQLLDLAPDGSSALISHAMILGSMHELDKTRSWRDGEGNPVRPVSLLRREVPIRPGETIGYEVLLPPTLWTIRAGHRIQLRISTQPPPADCPLFPMTGGAPVDTGCLLRPVVSARLEGGVYTIERGGASPSLINLPLLPASAWTAARSGTPPTTTYNLPLRW
ncbi:MAG: CocE/NonD family hydrolase [Thermomicrobiales bacterium]